jgi:hypothetical protein
MKLFLSESAFMGLILSSIEVYKKECLGLLLGYKLEDRFIVEYTVAYQSAKRMRNGVSPIMRDTIESAMFSPSLINSK